MELTREQLGNQAEEQGAFEGGVDPAGINRAPLPEGRRAVLEVDAERTEDGMALNPKAEMAGALLTLKEGPTSITSAQLLEEPEEYGLEVRRINGVEVEATAERALEIGRRSPREMLVWYGMHREYFGAVLGDRVIVRRDVLESEYSCKACSGRGYEEDAVCPGCGGVQEVVKGESVVPCPDCAVLGYAKESQWSSGRVPCSVCRGSGWRGGIIIPAVSQAKPITGIVVSLGPECKVLKLGDRVIHSKYAGHELEVSKSEAFTFMRESEVIGILRQRR